MRNLSPLPDDPLVTYDEIASRKDSRAVLQALRTRIKSAYKRYDTRKPALERLRPLGGKLSEDEANALRHCYEVATTPRDRLYARVRALATGRCPYCTIDTIASLDHYLPKESYPEFSVLSDNLIPSCSICNSPRDFRISHERALIHPYFDPIPDNQILVANVTVIRGVPEAEFSVDLSRCSDHEFGHLYERHLELLNLRERYRERAMVPDDGLGDIARTLIALGGKCGDAAVFLLRNAEGHERVLGANHFKTVLTRGAAASDEFLRYCLGGAS